jgi:hypothetical protein
MNLKFWWQFHKIKRNSSYCNSPLDKIISFVLEQNVCCPFPEFLIPSLKMDHSQVQWGEGTKLTYSWTNTYTCLFPALCHSHVRLVLAISLLGRMLTSLFLAFPISFSLHWMKLRYPLCVCVSLMGHSVNPSNNFHSPSSRADGCSELPEIPYAYWEKSIFLQRNLETFEVGTELKYHCKPGYRAISTEPQSVTCQENFTWRHSKGCESK